MMRASTTISMIAVAAAIAGVALIASGMPLAGSVSIGAALGAARESGRWAAWDSAQRWND
jgi:hypothetical protein